MSVFLFASSYCRRRASEMQKSSFAFPSRGEQQKVTNPPGFATDSHEALRAPREPRVIHWFNLLFLCFHKIGHRLDPLHEFDRERKDDGL